MTKRQRRAYVRARVQWRGLQEAGPRWGSAGELRRSCARWLQEAAAQRRAGGHAAAFCSRTAAECCHQLRARFGGVGLPS